MLARYHIRRGQPLSEQPLRVQRGRRQDTRKHTHHCLRPSPELVRALLASPPERRTAAWSEYARAYRKLIAERFAQHRAAFDRLARQASAGDVFLGCSCPSAVNPDASHCHVVLALQFMHEHYPDLEVETAARGRPRRAAR
jgi:Active DUF488-N3 subclade